MVEPLSCPECGSSRVSQTFCNAIGEVVGVGRDVPLRVEMLHCEDCDLTKFTGSWTIASNAHSVGHRNYLGRTDTTQHGPHRWLVVWRAKRNIGHS